MPIGLIAALFTLLVTAIIFGFNHKTKKLFNSYTFYLVTSTIALIYFIVFRWIWDLKDWIDGNDNNYIGGLAVVKSKVLLLDMCPFLAVFMPVVLIIDRKRRFVPAIAFFAIVGAGITIFGQVMFEKVGPNGNNHLINTTWWEYIFFNKLYFIMHFYIFVMALIVILNSVSFDKTRVLMAHGYAIAFFTYVIIMVFTLNIDRNATGIVENDWIGGQYDVLGTFFSNLGLRWPLIPIVAFSLVWIWILLMMLIRNTMVLDLNYIAKKQIEITFLRNQFWNLYQKLKK